MLKFKNIIWILIFLQLSCTINNTIESNGDRNLKSQKKTRDNYYIGISQNYINFDEAWHNAISNAHSLILSDLGINVKLTSTDIYRAIERHNFDTAVYMINREIKIESEHTIQSRVNRVYTEKKMNNGDILYNVWIELFFDKEAFYTTYHHFWNYEIISLKLNSLNLNGIFMQNFQRILTLKPKFDSEKNYLPNDITNKFQEIYDQYLNIFNSHKHEISLQNTSQKQKFSNLFIFKVINKYTKETLRNFPVMINNKPFISNSHGFINFHADFSTEIIATIGHGGENNFVVYQNNSFSPYDNKNISLRIRSIDKNLEKSFNGIFKEMGYVINPTHDLTLDIYYQKNTNRVSVTQFITELKLEIRLSHNNKTLRTIHLPLNKNDCINGYGVNEHESMLSAFSMEYYTLKKQALELIEQTIRSELIILE